MGFSIPIYSQVSSPGIPESFRISQKKNIVIPGKLLNTINSDSLLKKDFENGISNRYGIVQELETDLRASALKTEIPGKGFIWQYTLKTEKAFSLGILFKSYYLPEGASVFIYTPDHSQILGAFTSDNNSSSKMLAVAELKSNEAIIEYFEPYISQFKGEVILGSVSIAYRDIDEALVYKFIGINCPQGENWQDEKRSVCRITFQDAGWSYFCTGFLVDNLKPELIPYFMTAFHCINSPYSASTMVAYFNYENTGCTETGASEYQTLSGSSLIASNYDSDFSLLKLDHDPPAIYRAYLAGWDASGSIPLSGVGIHHPLGYPKNISVSDRLFRLYDEEIKWMVGISSKPDTHWKVSFNEGAVEEGSSGSPVFDQNHKVVGQLHGGESVSPFYGSFHYSWDKDSYLTLQLKNWLDPANTGKKVANGRYMRPVPLAGFSINNRKVCKNNKIILNDNSQCDPESWSWQISPSTFQFMDGSSDTDQNPQIQFTENGEYSVQLIARNQWGSDTIVKSDYLHVVDEIFVSLEKTDEVYSHCECELEDFPIVATGASDYIFSLSKQEKVDLVTSSNIVRLAVRDEQKKFGSFNAILRVDGSIGTCASSDSIPVIISMPGNDNIQDASLVYPGNNGYFSNFCASGEEREPFPIQSDCVSGSGWCQGSIEDSIHNSIWFSFFGPSYGRINIDTKGINDRIAVYEADSWQDILSGDPEKYSIVAANDDRSYMDATALLEDMDLSPGKKYWLQVESLDADTGKVAITLLTNGMEIFPNPSDGKFDAIISSFSDADINISIYSPLGELIFSRDHFITNDNNRFNFDLSGYPSGLFYIRLTVSGNVYSRKVLITH